MALWLILHAIAFVLATALTQVGGFAYLGTLLLSRRGPFARGFGFIKRTFLFLTIYGCLWTAASFTAPHFGRVPLPCHASDVTEIVVQSPLYCVLNRHYVTPELLDVANEVAAFMDNKFPGAQVLALDANFLFLDGFRCFHICLMLTVGNWMSQFCMRAKMGNLPSEQRGLRSAIGHSNSHNPVQNSPAQGDRIS
jgi:hypothetical protein